MIGCLVMLGEAAWPGRVSEWTGRFRVEWSCLVLGRRLRDAKMTGGKRPWRKVTNRQMGILKWERLQYTCVPKPGVTCFKLEVVCERRWKSCGKAVLVTCSSSVE